MLIISDNLKYAKVNSTRPSAFLVELFGIVSILSGNGKCYFDNPRRTSLADKDC